MELTFKTYLASLASLSTHADPTLDTAHSDEIRTAAMSLAEMPEVTAVSLMAWVREHPAWVPVLGLAVGLSRERLRNSLRHHFNTTGWVILTRERPEELRDAR